MATNYALYKPLPKEDAGAAVQFKYEQDISCLFIEATRQKGKKLPVGDKKQFDWSKKIVFKVNLVDIGQILTVLMGRKQTVELFHASERDGVTRNTIFKLTKQNKNPDGSGFDNYQLRLSKVETKEGRKGDPTIVQMYIDHHEMAILGVFFRRATEKMLGLS